MDLARGERTGRCRQQGIPHFHGSTMLDADKKGRARIGPA